MSVGGQEERAVAETPRKRRSRDAAATRRALLAAAQRRFTLLGYERTTVRDIAADAGVNMALVTRYFGGKDGLLRAVIESAPALDVEQRPTTPDLIDGFLEGLKADAWPQFGAHPLLLLLQDGGADADLEALRALARETSAARIAEWAGLDPGDGDAMRQRNVQLRSQLVLALLSGVVAQRSVAPVEPLASADPEELRPALQAAIEALLRGG